MLGWLRELRPSNLVLLAASPFLIWLFATNEAYWRSLVFILGVENNAGLIFVSFILITSAMAALLTAVILVIRGQVTAKRDRQRILLLSAIHVVLLLYAGLIHDHHAFYHSVVANALDVRSSTWLVPTEQSPTLTPEALATLDHSARISCLFYLALFGLVFLGPFLRRSPMLPIGAWLMLAIAISKLGYLLLFAHLGFATGLFVTLRAAILAYIAAAILGLGLAGLLGLRLGKRTLKTSLAIGVAMAIASAILFTRDTVNYRLVGSLEGRVAIIAGTPGRLSDTIRDGSFEAAGGERITIRSADTVERALNLLFDDERITAAFVPAIDAPPDVPVLWDVTFLPTVYRVPAIALPSQARYCCCSPSMAGRGNGTL